MPMMTGPKLSSSKAQWDANLEAAAVVSLKYNQTKVGRYPPFSNDSHTLFSSLSILQVQPNHPHPNHHTQKRNIQQAAQPLLVQVLVAPLLPKVSHPRQIPPISKYQSLPQRLDPWSRRHSFIRNEVLLLNLAILWKVRLQRELRISKSLLVHTLRMLGRAWITMPCLIPAPWFKYYRRVWYCILIRHKQRYREPLDRTGQNSSWMWSDASTVAGSARAIVSFVLYYSRQLFGEID